MTKTLYAAAVLGIVIFFINLLANGLGWYQEIAYFDKYVHVAGGVFVALAGAWLFSRLRPNRPHIGFFAVILFVVVIGLAWEGYEYVIEAATGAELATIPDSARDLVADIIGGIIGASFVLFGKKRYNNG